MVRDEHFIEWNFCVQLVLVEFEIRNFARCASGVAEIENMVEVKITEFYNSTTNQRLFGKLQM